MSRNTGERWFFLFFSFVVLIFSASYVPTVYGNDPASIERYLAVHEGRLLGDHVEILAVEDVGADRFVVFRLETKRPDERYVVRFRRNEQGNYEGHILENLYPSGPGRRIYSDFLRAGKDNTVYFAVWNEDPDLAQIQVLFAVGKEQQRETVTVAGEPSLTLLEFQGSATGFYADTSFLAADGSEL